MPKNTLINEILNQMKINSYFCLVFRYKYRKILKSRYFKSKLNQN